MSGSAPPSVSSREPRTDFQRIDVGDGVRLHVKDTARFKTTTIRVCLHAPLLAAEAASTALLPGVLRRGCRRFPSMRLLSHHLDELYAAELDTDIQKIGDCLILSVSLDLVSERFLPGASGLLEQGLRLLGDVLLDPLGDASSFPDDIVAQEKRQLANVVERQLEDRARYAVDRCLELMCAGEPFAVRELGTPAAIREVTAAGLRAHLTMLLASGPVDVVVIGAGLPPELPELVMRHIPLPRLRAVAAGTPPPTLRWPEPPILLDPPREPRRVSESLPGGAAAHGELVLGYRSRIGLGDALAPAMLLLDDLLGGGPTSRLFRVLREEEQLMYSISSLLVKSKGILLVMATTSAAACARAQAVTAGELDAIAHSSVDEQELEIARSQVLSQLRGIDDGPGSQIGYLLSRLIHGDQPTTDGLERAVARVTRAELSAAAASLRLDTAYFLSNGTGVEVPHA